MSSATRRRGSVRLLTALWTAGAIGAAVWVLARHWPEARSAAQAVAGWRLLGSAFFALLGVGLSGGIWHAVLRGLAGPVPATASARIFFVGQLGKYLPGSVWPLLAQARMGAAAGVPARVAATAGTLFLWVHLVTGLAVAAATLGGVGVVPGWSPWLVPVVLALLAPRLLGAVTGRVLRLLRREPLPTAPSWRPLVTAATAALAMWLCYGVHLSLLVSMEGLSSWRAAGVFAAGWAAGFAVVFAPAGAGAREAVLAGLLGRWVALPAALAVVILSRFLLTGADVVWGLLPGTRERTGGDLSSSHGHEADRREADGVA